MPTAGKSTVILVLAAFLIVLIPKDTIAKDKGARIGKLACSSGQIAKFNGSEWVCSPDSNSDTTDTLEGLSCASGEIAKFNGSEWVCSPDDNTDTLDSLICSSDQIAKFNGSEWECADVDGSGGPSPCPAGFVELNAKVCIEVSDRGMENVTWFEANMTCINADTRLCTVGEWNAACEQDIISDGTDNWEWLSDNFYHEFFARIGLGGCQNFLNAPGTGAQATFRCCLDR
jgi:hypothetical protein